MRPEGQAARLFQAGFLLAALMPVHLLVAAEPASSPGQARGKQASTPGDPRAVEVQFSDDSILKLVLRDERIELNTRFGKLLIPVTDVRRIEVGLRLPEDVTKRIESAINNLGSTQVREREAAAAELLGLRAKSYPFLLRAARHTDKETRGRARELMEKLHEMVPEDRLHVRTDDVVHTADSKFTGLINPAVLKVHTTQFGDLDLKLADVRSLRSAGAVRELPKNVLADPGSLAAYQGEVGKTLYFKVTGGAGGSVWGTDFYTTDSTLATAAVHAGALKQGETGVVKVTIVVPPPNFQGSTRNGVTTSNWDAYPGAFQVGRVEED